MGILLKCYNSAFVLLRSFFQIKNIIAKSLSKIKLQHFDILLFLFFVVFDFAFYFRKTLALTDINPYMLRDLDRSFGILSGQFPWVGPDTTPGGYSLGGFFYFLILPAVWIGGASPTSMIVYSLILRSLSFVFASRMIARRLGSFLTLIFLVIAAPSLLADIPYIWINNSTFVAILIPFLLWSLFHYFESTDNFKIISLFSAALLLGLFTHVHISFLYCLFLFFLSIYYREQTLKNRLSALGICISGFLLTSLPYFLAYLNSLYGYVFDGPHFQFFVPEVGDYFIRFKNNFFIRKDPGNGHFFLWQWENIILYTYLILRISYEYFFAENRSDIFKYIIWIALWIGALNFPFVGSYMEYRYLFVGHFLALLVLAIDLSHVRSKAWIAVAFCFFSAYFFFIRSPLKPMEYRLRNHLLIENAQQLCDYFNEKKISFPTFVRQSFEVQPSDSSNSFWHTRYCFNDTSSLDISSSLRYFIVHPKLWNKKNNSFSSGVTFPDEINEAWRGRPLRLEAETQNYLLLSYKYLPSRMDHYLRLSDLTYMYELDPGRAFMPQMQGWKNNPVFTANSEIKIQEARLCKDPLFCSIYMLSQYENGKVKLLLTSRILQTVWHLPPVGALLEDLKLHVLCDNSEKIIPLASRIGSVSADNFHQSFNTPLVLTVELSCKEIQPVTISAKKQTLKFTNKPFEYSFNLRYALQEL